jgi:hypothetical protein
MVEPHLHEHVFIRIQVAREIVSVPGCLLVCKQTQQQQQQRPATHTSQQTFLIFASQVFSDDIDDAR